MRRSNSPKTAFKISWRRAASSVVVLAVLGLGACSRINPNDVTGSINPAAPTAVPDSTAAGRAMAAQWKSRYEANPADKVATMNYAIGLRGATQYSQAVAVLRGLAIKYPEDRQVLAAYGKALADAGQLQEAAAVLSRAHTPENPDWSVLSAQGSVADEMGNHAAAREFYAAALKIRPNEPAVLSNLGLSYALSKDLPKAEDTLRLAVAQPGADARVRQNFALVLALAGKFDEARKIELRDLAPADADANIASIRQMIAQSDTWRNLQGLDRRSGRGRPAKGARQSS